MPAEAKGPIRGPSARQTRNMRLAAIAAAIAGALMWAMWPRAVEVDAGLVTKGPMTVRITEEGKTRIKDVFVVSAPQSGIMLRSPLLAGDPVTKDKTLVALLQPAQPPFLDLRTRLEVTALVKAAEAGVNLATAELERARSDLAFAEAETKRTKTLAESKTASPRALEQAQHQENVARAAVTKAEANVDVSKRQLQGLQARLVDPADETLGGIVEASCCVEVRAPITGRVLRVYQTSEQVLPAGTPLAEIGDPRNLEVVVELLSSDAVKVAEGASVDIDGWGGDTILHGKVRRIEAAGFTKISALGIEEQRVRAVIDLAPANAGSHQLGHEFRVMTHIHVWDATDVLRLPVGAMFRYQGAWAVYRIDGGRARLTPIRIGQRNNDYAEAVDGLTVGTGVILHPSDRVIEGQRVTARAIAGRAMPGR